MPLPPASAAVARALFRLARRADAACVPVPADLAVCGRAAPARATLRRELEAGDVDAAFATLRRADAQVAFLAAASPPARADLAAWHALLAQGEEDGGPAAGPTPHADAFVRGALLLQTAARAPPPPAWAADGAGDDADDARDDATVVHDAAAAVAAAAGVRGDATAALPPDAARALAAAFAATVRPRALPFEWLYEGLAPLNPAAVAAGGRAAPFGVAALAAAAAAAAGVDVVPVRVPPPPGAGPPPPALAARLAARAPAASPDSDGWLLVPPGGGWAWDAAAGRVTVDPGDAPPAARLVPPHGAPPPSAGARAAWAGGLAAAVVAHTRRGDADAVADVVVQALALDAGGGAWGEVGVGV